MKKDIYTRGITYPHHFFWAPLEQIEQVYKLDNGLLAAGARGNNVEVLWGVQKFAALQAALERVKQDYATFLFRVGGTLQEVQKRQQEVVRWGYKLQLTHVEYALRFFESPVSPSALESISECQSSEKEAIYTLSHSLFPLFALSKQEFEDSRTDSASSLFVARRDNEVIGYVYGRIIKHQQGFIRELGVHPAYRRQGWGEHLMRYMLSYFQTQGIPVATLWVDYDNQPARALYEKLGFTVNYNQAEAVFVYQTEM